MALALAASAAAADITFTVPLIGTGAPGSNLGGGKSSSTELNGPEGVVAAAGGGVYVSDTRNNRVLHVSGSGKVTLFAGSGREESTGDGGPATAGGLLRPTALVVDGGGVVIAEPFRVRKVDGAGNVKTIGGTGIPGYGGDGGPAVNAKFDTIGGLSIATDNGTLVADTNNHRIRRIDPGGSVTTVAGTGSEGFSGDGGSAKAATLSAPSDVAALPNGGYVFSDLGNGRIRWVDADGAISTIAGGGSRTPTSAAIAPSELEITPVGVAVSGASIAFTNEVEDSPGQLVEIANGKAKQIAESGNCSGTRVLCLPHAVSAARGGWLVSDANGHAVYFVGSAQPPIPAVGVALSLKKVRACGKKAVCAKLLTSQKIRITFQVRAKSRWTTVATKSVSVGQRSLKLKGRTPVKRGMSYRMLVAKQPKSTVTGKLK
ncbi:MAG: hypothetical protein WAO61_06860 [Solirubrobacterales bacterium]